jgi:hypothetical protein
MRRHRFDPYSFVFGISFMVLSAVFLNTAADLTDLAGAGWLPLPAVVLGLLLLAFGLDRARPPAGPTPAPGDAEGPEPPPS